jgi:DNA-binding GntR family transcriptional regulator
MAADPTAAERAYGDIKRKLLDGGFHLRQRLDAGAIAGDLGLSTTPVREALVRLTAERLIAARPAQGHYVALWSQDQLVWLYAWRASLAELASQALRAAPAIEQANALAYPRRAALLLQRLHENGNPEMLHAAQNADDRLHHARKAEAEIWSDAEGELERLALALSAVSSRVRRSALRAYHKRRIASVRQIRERAILIALPNGA